MVDAVGTSSTRIHSSSPTHGQPARTSLDQVEQATLVAARIARTLAPASLLDISAGDAVSAQLLELGVKAEYVQLIGPQPATVPAGQWEVALALGVLEQLAPDRAEIVLEALCAVADTIIVSCGPASYFAPTYATVRPAVAWASAFAERGFFRRTDLDFEFAGPWTVVFVRGAVPPRDIVTRYEQALSAARAELSDRSSGTPHAPSTFGASDEVAELRAANASLRHDLLVARDHAIGQEATIARLRDQRNELRGVVDAVYSSTTWRLGTAMARPAWRVKRALGRP